MKKAMTLLGPVAGDQLGHILPHEHILMEMPYKSFTPMYPDLVERKVTIDMLGRLRRQIWTCNDNLRLDDPETARQEVASFKASGGGTIVDVTTIGLKRDVRAVAEIGRQTGVHIIAGTGVYVKEGHPATVAGQTVEELTGWMVKELTEGIDGSGLRAGIIGELGVSSPMNPDEEKVVRAGLRAHRLTGAPVSIHQIGGNELEQIDALVEAEGVDPRNVILCHMGSATAEQRLRAAGRGYYVEIDCFGNEFYTDAMAGKILQDPERIRMVKALLDAGYLRQLLISNDICLKMQLKKYGGWSYEHIKVNIKPFMLRMGIPPKAVDSMIYYNPMRAIAYLDQEAA